MHGTYTFFIFPPIFCLCGWFCSCYGEGRSEWGCKFSATETEIVDPRCRTHHLHALCPCRRIGLGLASCPAGLTAEGRMLDAAIENPHRGTGSLHFTSLKPDRCHLVALPQDGRIQEWTFHLSHFCFTWVFGSFCFICVLKFLIFFRMDMREEKLRDRT